MQPTFPRWRRDLRGTELETADGREFAVEDQLRGTFHRLGEAEYLFAVALNGERTLDDALAETHRRLPTCELDRDDAKLLCDWLFRQQLIEIPGIAVAAATPTTGFAALVARCNPFYIRLPLLRPGVWLDQLTTWVAPLFGVRAGLAVLCFAAYILWRIIDRWSAFTGTAQSLMLPQQQLAILGVWVLIKACHELGHAVVCRRYGGEVRELGIVLILFVPTAYVDVTSSWRMSDRRHRMHVAAAGMYVELLLAALAGFAWCTWPEQPWSDLAAHTVMMTGLSTLLCNLNPLARFDGYYLLSDWWGIPNLRERSQQVFHDFVKSYVLGMHVPPSHEPARRRLPLALYAAGSLWWQWSVSLSLIVAAGAIFHGAGIVFSLLAVGLWFVAPLWRTLRFLRHGDGRERPGLARAAGIAVLAAAVAITAAVSVPLPHGGSAPGIVEYAPDTVVRAAAAGFIEEVLVADGDSVSEGQPLIRLVNDEITLELARLTSQVKQLELQIRGKESQGALTESKQLEVRRDDLLKQLAETQTRSQALTLVAPHAGAVIGRGLANLPGRFVRQGDEVLAVGDERAKQVRLSLSQQQVSGTELEDEVPLRVPGLGRLTGRFRVIEPRAKLRPPHAALCVPFGGPLAVRLLKDREMEFLEPRLEGIVLLDPAAAQSVRAGCRVTAYPAGGRQTFATWLFGRLHKHQASTFVPAFSLRDPYGRQVR